MEIRSLNAESVMADENQVLCLGFFDGMHLAHQALITEAIALGKAKNIQTGLMTFSTQVMAYLKNERFFFLTPIEAKIKFAEEAGFDFFYVLEVNADLVGMEAEAFIARFLSRANTIVVGFDFSFGKYGKGSVESLLAHPEFTTVVMPEMTDGAEKIGSTRIRELLSHGKVDDANRLLGKPYCLKGKVVSGKGRGKILGFPTANIDYDGFFLPQKGVYATLVEVNGELLKSMTNIGDNPTFFGKTITVESHIFRFGADLYGKIVKIYFMAFTRNEIKYTTTADLIEQMRKDRDQVERFFETGRIV